jgi:hypothetical protein
MRINCLASLQTVARFALCALWALVAVSCKGEKKETPAPRADGQESGEFAPGIAYTNYRYADVPWSIYVVRMNRADPSLGIRAPHAAGGVGGVSRVSDQMAALRQTGVEPLAGVNGDFYARDRSAYAGDPRGLQIVDGDLISAPIGGVAFWIDADGGLHLTNVVSEFKVTWPDGQSLPFGLNQARTDDAVLYTPAMGVSTATRGGMEVVLEAADKGQWLPLPVGETLTARVREVRPTGNTRLAPDIMVLSLPPALAGRVQNLAAGGQLKLSTATTPVLRGAISAISGGPVLVRNGVAQRIQIPRGTGGVPYEFRSMVERHPRAAIGWNDRHFFLMQVDGRQRDLSMGMTLEELGKFALKQLRVTDAMNLDGGVSATLWANGRVRNSPADHGQEKDLANSVAIVRQKAAR